MNASKWLLACLVIAALPACMSRPKQIEPVLTPEQVKIKEKFRGIRGLVTRIDATAPGKKHVTMTTEDGTRFAGSAVLSPKVVNNSSYGGGTLLPPITLRVMWREGVTGMDGKTGSWTGGTVAGDQTIKVAERIPDELLDTIRQSGGALRIKIRIKDDQVLLGWDIEKIVPYKDWKPGTGLHSGINYLMPGGDFFEGFPVKGGYLPKPWYLNAQGQRVEADD